ncbi:CLUMA_CG017206, isoform A [Clunio marinus]|uniref:1-acylglycerol-3-phosphate O-acyltransferase n=1 Tax=Clunio marinus TaxID=568069 RepID=A0A1J1IV57_9DIPT|nr:CLUMA_CG017206, isoform A [Clunio marinus]
MVESEYLKSLRIKLKLGGVLNIIIYYLKYAIFFCFVNLSLWIIIATAIITRRFRNSRNALFCGMMMQKVGRLLGVNIISKISDEININESYLFIINHQSYLDAIIMSHILTIFGNAAPVSKKFSPFLLHVWAAAYFCDGIILDEKDKTVAKNAMNEKIISLKTEKRNFILFPEGSRNDSTELLPFKKGAFKISEKTHMKIIPVVVQKFPFLDHRKKVFGKGIVHVEFLSPMLKSENESIDEFTQRAYEIMNSKYHSMNPQ